MTLLEFFHAHFTGFAWLAVVAMLMFFIYKLIKLGVDAE
jgi:hypothetical protein